MCYARFAGSLRARRRSGSPPPHSVRPQPQDETLPAADAGGRATPSVPIGRVYGCKTIGYLLLCIWHIVKLIERDDKIAMFFDVKRGERLARERTGSAVMKRKREGKREERQRGEEGAAGGRRPNLR